MQCLCRSDSLCVVLLCHAVRTLLPLFTQAVFPVTLHLPALPYINMVIKTRAASHTQKESVVAGGSADLPVDRIIGAMRAELDDFKSEMRSLLREREDEVTLLKSEVSDLRAKVLKLEVKLDDTDAYERRDTIVFSGEGIPESTQGENSSTIVCNLLRDKLNLNVSNGDLSTCHRLGKRPITQKPDRRKIIVKLCRRDLKKDILSACKSNKPNFYANEDLTPVKNSILFALRKIKREFPGSVKGAGSRDGRVYAYVQCENSPPGTRDKKIHVNSYEHLSQSCLDYTGKVF